MLNKNYEYKYETFDDWFKSAARTLWDVKEWDNRTIKAWLQGAFEDSRAVAKNYEEEICPVCGYYCLGKGGVNCIDKPKLCGIDTAPPQPKPSVDIGNGKALSETLKRMADNAIMVAGNGHIDCDSNARRVLFAEIDNLCGVFDTPPQSREKK